MNHNSDKKELSFEQAIEYLIEPIPSQSMGENTLVIGKSDRYLRLRLCVSFMGDHYDLLAADLFVDDVHSTGYRLRVNQPESAPPRATWNNPDLDVGQGGFYWAPNRRFYNWVPDNGRIVEQLKQIVRFHQLTE